MTDADLVVAARAGDGRSLEELARRHLPLVYNLVQRALDASTDVDDVEQDIMLRAVRQLPGLRDPSSFRAWLAAIAVHQVGTHLSRVDAAGRREARLDEWEGWPDPAADVEGVSLLRTELAAQRRQVRDAGRWLAAGDRAALAVWWLEAVGELTRAEAVVALGVSVAHAGVRLQRMRDQLETCRAVVAALKAGPACGRLATVTADWNGMPSPVWRKRVAKHIASCPQCTAAAQGRVPIDRLLAGIALLPVPAMLAVVVAKAMLAGKMTATAAKVWSLSSLVQAAAAHPVAATVTAGTLALGVTVTTTGWSAIAPPWTTTNPASPDRTATAPAAAGPLRTGRVSLESTNTAGQYITVSGDLAALAPAGPGSDAATRRKATFETVPGLANPACFSFRAPDGRYLRHSSWRLRLDRDQGTTLFRGDATFCVHAGATAGSVSLESANFPGRYLRHVRAALWVDPDDSTTSFRADGSFVVRPPLA